MDVEALLGRLVAWPTVSDRPVTGIAAELANCLEAVGMRVETLEATEAGKCNLVCSAGPAGTDGVVLSGHMDVVPVEGQPWTSDPFVLTRRGDRLVGRGACDMKAFLAAIVVALTRTPPRDLRRELVLMFTHDEEVGCLGSRALADKYAAEGRTLPTLALIGEPTSFHMLRMHPGHVAARITCAGRAAHSSRPDLGQNAIRLAARVIDALDALAERWRHDVRFPELLERPFVVMNVATIHGGNAVNIVPDRCIVDLGFRPLPGMSPEALFEEIREAVEPLGSVRAELVRVTPAMLTPAGTPLEALLRPWAASPDTAAASFATDGGNFERLGMRTLVFGPGSIDVAHKADEYVPIDELHRAVDVVDAVVAHRCRLP
ncbi:MAG: acetylornithine deacetylase [Pseudomonadota bacterium]|nr:acetylornithine deacetylase [Pseudomonadota bacterium]